MSNITSGKSSCSQNLTITRGDAVSEPGLLLAKRVR